MRFAPPNRYHERPRMPVKRGESTKKLNKELQIRFEIPSFKKVIFDQKSVKQSNKISNDIDSGRLSWILIVGASVGKDGFSANDTCYAKLRLVNTEPAYLKSFPLTYTFGLLNAAGGIDFKTEPLKANSSDLITISGNKTELFTKRKLMANKNQVVINEAVTVVCQVNIEDDPEGSDEDNEAHITNHLELMLRDPILADVTIVTSDLMTIRAHKMILVRSPVFRAMFTNEMKEKINNEVVVKNFKHDIMQELLKYIYTDKVGDLRLIAGDLLVAADYYDLPELKKICIKALEENVNTSNFAHSLFVAERLQIISIREAVLKFVIQNRKTITQSQGWEELKAFKELHDYVIAAVFDTSF